MRKYRYKVSKLKSNLFLRMVLCLCLLMFGALFVRFSNYMVTYAKTSDADVNEDENEVIYININQNNDSNDYIELYEDNKNSIKSSETEKVLAESYVTASLENADKYPQNWIRNFNNQIIILQNTFPSGKYWNHMGKEAANANETNNIYSVTDIPCNHWKNGECYCNAHYGKSDDLYPYEATCTQCRGFASLLSDLIFGEDAPVRYFEDYDELRIGDQARIDGDYHTVFIIDKTDDYVIVAECNRDLETCKIEWGRRILREDLNGWYISRWE